MVAKEQAIVNDEIEQMLKFTLKEHKPKATGVVQGLIDGIQVEDHRNEESKEKESLPSKPSKQRSKSKKRKGDSENKSKESESTKK